MVKNTRMERYKQTGAGAGLVRVEVLVPPDKRDNILKQASLLRAQHRSDSMNVVWNTDSSTLYSDQEISLVNQFKNKSSNLKIKK